MLVLSACSVEGALEDLHEFTLSVHHSDQFTIDPLPTINPSESFRYRASNIINPFSEENILPDAPVVLQIDPVLPDQNRIRQVLEYFPLDALKMVGSLAQNKQIYAIIFTPDNTVHRVTYGNYIGKQLGKIIEVSDAKIVLEETIMAKNGRWEKRKVSLALTDS